VSDFDPILAIMNPRQIPECISAFKKLDVRKAWLQNYAEQELVEVIASIVRDESIHFTHLCLVADDCITRRPLMGETPTVGAYDFYSFLEVEDWPGETLPTGFVGFALTCMSREMWREFPFGCFANGPRGYASDFHLTRRLRDAGVPMVAARDGYVTHVKEQWNKLDRAPEKRLMIGEAPPGVRHEG
jgi:GT2 family glycosyltransferase